MAWTDAFELSLRALWRSKTRAALTALGVIIGVAAVIAMLGVGRGARDAIAEQFEAMGSHNLVVRSGSVTRGGARAGIGTVTTLTLSDAAAIAELPGIVAAAPSVRAAAQVRYRGTNWRTSVEGVQPDYLGVRAWPLEEGQFIATRDVGSAAHVCVLGRTVARRLFGLARPVGETILVESLPCRVLGVLAVKGATAWGTDQDDTILAPITTVQRKLLGITYVERIEIQAAGREAALEATEAVRRRLRERHRLRDGEDDDFALYNRAEWAESAEESARIFAWLLGTIASISLLVGGIGIMNIMLVAVTERTREIGIRMAVGARRRDVLWQFLIEAVVLSGAGGVLGILTGVGGAVAVGSFSQFSVSVTPGAVGVAFLFSALVGIFFGLHPARRASRLSPIEALRHE